MSLTQAKKLELITKHGRKFASKSEATPVLQGIRYLADGSVVVMDRHKLLRIGCAHGFTQEFTSHAVTGATIDGQYPDTSRIIPRELPTQITLIANGRKRDDVKDAISRIKLAVEAAKVTGDKTFMATLSCGGSTVSLSVTSAHPSFSLNVGISAEIYGPDAEVTFNAELFLAALNVFKDAGSRRVIIGITGAASPIVIRDEENEIDAIVLPYRRGGVA